MFAVGKADTLVRTNIDKGATMLLPSVLDHLEGTLITLMEPALNKRGANWNGAMQFFQDIPEESDRTLEEVTSLRKELADLAKRVK